MYMQVKMVQSTKHATVAEVVIVLVVGRDKSPRPGAITHHLTGATIVRHT